MSSPLDMPPLDSSMPIVWASDGELGSGGTLGAVRGPPEGVLW